MEPAQPIQFPDGPPMPEMREALLDAEQLHELINDLTQCTRILAVQCKTQSRSQTPVNNNVTLGQAAELLWNQEILAVQVKYFYDEYEWTDTLLRLPTGVRLVRCRHE